MEPEPVAESIKQSIAKNGFPEKIVRLPFKPIYDCCKKNGTSLSQVLSNLKEEKIVGKIQGDFIVFHAPGKSIPEPQGTSPDTSGDFARFKQMPDIGNMQGLALEHLSKMTPEQIADLRQMAENLTDEQKTRIFELFAQMNKPKS